MIFTIILILPISILCEYNVKYVAIVYRHGDRTPVDPYPTDPWRNETYWPVPFGELTNVGKMQHYKFGQWLRKRYSNLISEKFDPTEVYVRSTDVDRTLMSAQTNLAGFYPPTGNAVWNPSLMWQPIPIHTVPEKEDEVLAMKKECPAFDQEYTRLMNSNEYKQRLTKYQKLMDYLSAYTGMKVKTYYDIDSIYSVLKIEKLYNFTLPDWTQAVFPDEMIEPAGYSFRIDTYNTFMARLKIGPLLKEITGHMTTAIIENIKGRSGVKKKHLKMTMYSGHDLTIGSFLNGLGMYDGKPPVYTASVILEILEDDSSPPMYFVRISYRNFTDLEEPHVLNIPYCGQMCPFERFVTLYSKLIDVKWERDCQIQYTPLPIYFIVVLIFFGLVCIAHKVHYTQVTREYRRLEVPNNTMPVVNSPVSSSLNYLEKF